MRICMPWGLLWAIPSCMIIVVINAFAIYFLIATDKMQRQFCGVLSRIPYLGPMMVKMLSAGSRVFSAPRKSLQWAVG